MRLAPPHGSLEDRAVSVEIRQTWTKLGITLETEESRSVSTIGGMSVHGSAKPELVYEYRNEPRSNAADGMHAHRGLARLQLSEPNQLGGDYFTGRDRNTHGVIHLERSW